MLKGHVVMQFDLNEFMMKSETMVGKSLSSTAAVNVAIMCILNIRRRENSLMKQILDVGRGDFSSPHFQRKFERKSLRKKMK